jgi:ABC-type uncharacterized transport system permease subunit
MSNAMSKRKEDAATLTAGLGTGLVRLAAWIVGEERFCTHNSEFSSAVVLVVMEAVMERKCVS